LEIENFKSTKEKGRIVTMADLTTYELNLLIGQRAEQKEEFRAALLSDPKKALEQEFEVVIPDNIKIELHEETKNTMHLIVPMSAKDTLELTDDQLEQVGGGVSLGSNMCVAYGAPGAWHFPNANSNTLADMIAGKYIGSNSDRSDRNG
jgi:hypothetical protein